MTPDEILAEIRRRDIHTRSTPFPAHAIEVWADGKQKEVCRALAQLETAITGLIGCSAEDYETARLDYVRRMPSNFTISRTDKYKRGDIEDSFGRRLFRDGKGRL